ncbi:MAG: D-2-hydroxyacid dehydrogenase [Proteobacteria bacterium]|nr:D-2-hydroxyacid dehydrogenase [Pseudomonadota bacterium]
MKAVFLDFGTMGARDLDPSPLAEVVPDFEVFDSTPQQLVAERVDGVDFVFTNKIRLTGKIISAAGSLRFIGLTATGVDNVDLEAARKQGIAVCNIRAYCTQSVVEHVFAVLLNLTHSIGQYAGRVRSGAWQQADNFCMLEFPIRELSVMTIGIVGHGELGGSVADMARQFGMSVMLARRPGQPETADDGRFDISDILQQCDVVSLHCPLTGKTRGLIGVHELELMKPNAILINTARGGLIDTAALVEALNNGTIAAAAIDVLPQEPPVDGDPLLDYEGDNLILTPHIAWGTVEARQSAINEVAANVRSFLAGEERNRVI